MASGQFLKIVPFAIIFFKKPRSFLICGFAGRKTSPFSGHKNGSVFESLIAFLFDFPPKEWPFFGRNFGFQRSRFFIFKGHSHGARARVHKQVFTAMTDLVHGRSGVSCAVGVTVNVHV